MIDYTEEPQHKQFPVRLNTDLYNAFFSVFPDYGARSVFIREAIRAALKQLAEDDGKLNLPEAVRIALKSPSLRIRLSCIGNK